MIDAAEQDIRRGEHAERLLADPLVKEALTVIKAECVAAWEQTPARDADGRERLWTMYKLAQKFEAHFASLIENGKMASARIAQVERERKFPFLR